MKKHVYTSLIILISISNLSFSQEYTEKALGQERIEHWTLESPAKWNSPDIWKTLLNYRPDFVLSGNVYLNFHFISDLNWLYGSWYWQNDTLYLKNRGNPDSTKINVSAIKEAGGYSVTSGDFNGDALQDIVTLTFEDSSCHIFYGNADLSSIQDHSLKTGKQLNQVSSAGDINGDGYDDLLAARRRKYTNEDVNVYIYYGSASGLNSASKVELSFYSTGVAVSKHSGDFNNDGFDDVLISTGGNSRPPRFYLFYGKSAVIGPNPDHLIEFTSSPSGPLGISFIGDINNDGFDDIAVPLDSTTALLERVRIYYGSSAGLDITNSQLLEIDAGHVTTFSHSLSVSKTNDLNNDGIDDLILGDPYAPGSFEQEGKIFIFYGSSDSLNNNPDLIINNPFPGLNSRFGGVLEGVGDINNDGIDDLVTGSWFTNRAFIFFGSTKGISDSNMIILSVSHLRSHLFGWNVSKVGNFSNDCRNSFVVSETFGIPFLFLPASSMNFSVEDECYGTNQYFHIHSCVHPDSVHWNFGDPASGINNISRDTLGIHHYSHPGSFDVELKLYANNNMTTIKKTIAIESPITFDLGNDTSICEGEQLTLDVTSAAGSYLWSDSSTSHIKTISTSGELWLRVTNSCGSFTDTVNVTVTYEPPVTVDLGSDRVICEEDSVTFDVSSLKGSYLWSDGATSPVKTINTTSKIWLMVTNLCGSSTDTVNVLVKDCYVQSGVSVYPTPAISFVNIGLSQSTGINNVAKFYNLAGSLCLEKRLETGIVNRIPLNLQPGTYILRIWKDEILLDTKKLIVVR